VRLRVLLINPWIYDFAAYNLWAKPLGLLWVAEYMSAYDVDMFFIDCTDDFAIRNDGTGKFKRENVEKPEILKSIPRLYKRYGIGIDEFVKRIKSAMPFDIVLMTSTMSYWYPGVQKTVQIIRELAGNVPVILGGIYATLYYDHAIENSGADFIYTSNLDERINSVLRYVWVHIEEQRKIYSLLQTPSL